MQEHDRIALSRLDIGHLPSKDLGSPLLIKKNGGDCVGHFKVSHLARGRH
jgi:hypothetical protein